MIILILTNYVCRLCYFNLRPGLIIKLIWSGWNSQKNSLEGGILSDKVFALNPKMRYKVFTKMNFDIIFYDMQLVRLLNDELLLSLQIYPQKSNFRKNLRYKVLTAQWRYGPLLSIPNLKFKTNTKKRDSTFLKTKTNYTGMLLDLS